MCDRRTYRTRSPPPFRSAANPFGGVMKTSPTTTV
jgi:hypothetical protein